MSAAKDIIKYSEKEILEIVSDDFTASEEDRRGRNWQNYLNEKTFRGIDIMQPMNPNVGDNNLGLGQSDSGGGNCMGG